MSKNTSEITESINLKTTFYFTGQFSIIVIIRCHNYSRRQPIKQVFSPLRTLDYVQINRNDLSFSLMISLNFSLGKLDFLQSNLYLFLKFRAYRQFSSFSNFRKIPTQNVRLEIKLRVCESSFFKLVHQIAKNF